MKIKWEGMVINNDEVVSIFADKNAKTSNEDFE